MRGSRMNGIKKGHPERRPESYRRGCLKGTSIVHRSISVGKREYRFDDGIFTTG